MSDVNFTTTFTVDRTPEEAFAAINNVRRWWSGNIDGDTDKLGGEFTYRYEDIHRSTQRITEHVPGKRVVWPVLDGHLNFTDDKTEWTGTDIAFDISTKDDTTEVRFTHMAWFPTLNASIAAPAPGASTSTPACGTSSRPVTDSPTSRKTRMRLSAHE